MVCLVDLDETHGHITSARERIAHDVLTHGSPFCPSSSQNTGCSMPEYTLTLYRRAKCVVTTRLHAALPCLAFRDAGSDAGIGRRRDGPIRGSKGWSST